MRRLVGLPSLTILLTLASSAPIAVAEDEGTGHATAPADMRVEVRIAIGKDGELPVRRHVLATVVTRPDRLVSLATHVTGLVEGVRVVEGQRVESGTTLLVIRAAPLEEALAKAKAAVRVAEAERARSSTYGLDAEEAELDRAKSDASALVAPAQRELDRLTGLQREGVGAQKALDDARVALEAAMRGERAAEEKRKALHERGRTTELARLEALVDQARADVGPAERLLAGTVVKAPVGGRIVGLAAIAGQSLEAGVTFATLIPDDGLGLRFTVSPTTAPDIALGAEVFVIEPELHGTVRAIAPAVDRDTGLLPVLASLDAPAAPPPLGATFEAELGIGAPVHGVLVPVAALETTDADARVVVVGEGDLAHGIPVVVHARNREFAAVTGEGLVTGVRVVIEGNFNLPDGAHVVVLAPAEAKAPDAKEPAEPKKAPDVEPAPKSAPPR